MARILAVLLVAAALHGQTNIAIPFTCGTAEIDSSGLTCSEADPCPVYLEISQVFGRGNKVIATGNLHTAALTLDSVLLYSDDGGLSWIEPFKRLPSATLDRVQFVDDKTGWISGQTMVPVPTDPFLLLTTDGGKSWRQQTILEEDSPGRLMQFGFLDARRGYVVLDRGTDRNRYELYETLAGGGSWSIQSKTTQPPAVPGGNAVPDDWRVRADAKAKVSYLERQQGENWSKVAAVPIEAGRCKPDPVVEPVAPPPQTEAAPQPEKDYVEELHLGGTPPPAKSRKKPKK